MPELPHDSKPAAPSDAALDAWLIAEGFPAGSLTATIAHGLTPLMQAARRGRLDIIDALLAAGVPTDTVNGDGNNALWLACFHGDPAIIARLLAAGIALDHQNDSGATCLMYAASASKHAVVEQLLAAGANPGLRNQDEFTALDMAASLECLQPLRAASRRSPDT